MAACVVCGREVEVTAACPHCARPCCDDHRPPPAHDCPGVDADRTRGWVVDLDGSGNPAGRPSGGATGETPADGHGSALDLVRSGGWLAAGTLLLVVAVLTAAVLAPPVDAELDEERAERLIADGVNDRRRAAGLDALAYNGSLAAVAEAHSRDMARRGYVDHVSPDGEGLPGRYDRFGVDCAGGENVYFTPRGRLIASERALAAHVVEAWMDSPGHREALLAERFTAQGIGVVVAPDGGVYATQNFC